MTIDSADVFRRMARVKSWSRNGDILELMDVLEHLLMSRDEQAARTVTPGDSGKAECPDCAKRRASDLARQRRKRQRAKAA